MSLIMRFENSGKRKTNPRYLVWWIKLWTLFFGSLSGALSTEPPIFNYHLQHPGGESSPGDPNAAFFLDGKYHLHYILNHPWGTNSSYSYIHVTSPDMVHWEWQSTKLQPSLTGHGMFSGTGFFTQEGRPAIIYHGQVS